MQPEKCKDADQQKNHEAFGNMQRRIGLAFHRTGMRLKRDKTLVHSRVAGPAGPLQIVRMQSGQRIGRFERIVARMAIGTSRDPLGIPDL